MERPKTTHYQFFCNRECEYFPCHKNADPDNFNCLFCYCPLYALGKKCGGQFRYLPNGNKDCSNCTFPHKRENYKAITSRGNCRTDKRKKLIIIAQPQYSGIDIIFIYLFCLCLMCTADWYHSSISHIKQRPFKAYHIF